MGFPCSGSAIYHCYYLYREKDAENAGFEFCCSYPCVNYCELVYLVHHSEASRIYHHSLLSRGFLKSMNHSKGLCSLCKRGLQEGGDKVEVTSDEGHEEILYDLQSV